MTLNVACGNSKIIDCINIDMEPSCKPDVLANVLNGLPYKDGEVDKIYFFHAIEHIPKRRHEQVLTEFHRVLKPDGKLVITYPEFAKCALNWINNHRGLREFWEATLYGRQLYPSDYHIALMDSFELRDLLIEVGFKDIAITHEPLEEYNSVCKCLKGVKMATYEDVVRQEIFG